MRRIVFPIGTVVLISVIALISCTSSKVDPPGPESETKRVTLSIHIPKPDVTTYAGEDASIAENHIDTLYIDLKQAGVTIHTEKLSGNSLDVQPGSNDSIVHAGFEVDNITTGPLTVEVYANRNYIQLITDEIPLPDTSDPATLFMMSGSAGLSYEVAAYHGTVHLIRNVAKLRLRVSKHPDCLPSDLIIDYDNIKVRALNVPNQTTLFGPGDATGQAGFNYITCSERTGAGLRKAAGFSSTDGGQIDSLYLHENYLNNEAGYNQSNKTLIKITIPTKSMTEGEKTDSYEYAIFVHNSYRVLRNFIYTLDVRVRGQSLEPAITMSVSRWNDLEVGSSVLGTYLTAGTSVIEFDGNGNAVINFCTDAQALYIDWSDVKNQINRLLMPEGVEVISTEKGQILLDKQHCGSFGFKLDITQSEARYVSGRICMQAGNITRCISILSNRLYDAHYIVGDPLMESGNTFTHATVEDGTPWLQLSKNKPYKPSEMLQAYTEGTATPLFLHLDENLTGAPRTGTVSMTGSDGAEQKLKIEQLPALYAGKFGSASTAQDDVVYEMDLYTEQRPEDLLIPYKTVQDELFLDIGLYSGKRYLTGGLDPSKYMDDYRTALYPAINYCAYKNRDKNGNGVLEVDEVDWYLPAQAQLMGLWTSFNGYWKEPASTFPPDVYWSATNNGGFFHEAQMVNFSYGNVGHVRRTQGLSVRCVRNYNNADQTMITSSGTAPDDFPVIDFEKGMPAGSFSSESKNSSYGSDQSAVNSTVYTKLRVAKKDCTDASGNTSSGNWYDLDDACHAYDEDGTGWRLPTQREMQAIWIFQEEIKIKCSSFVYLAGDYYWTATENSTYTANVWCIWGEKNVGGNTPNQSKTGYALRARCVKEL